jgi:hypothetical protein
LIILFLGLCLNSNYGIEIIILSNIFKFLWILEVLNWIIPKGKLTANTVELGIGPLWHVGSSCSRFLGPRRHLVHCRSKTGEKFPFPHRDFTCKIPAGGGDVVVHEYVESKPDPQQVDGRWFGGQRLPKVACRRGCSRWWGGWRRRLRPAASLVEPCVEEH